MTKNKDLHHQAYGLLNTACHCLWLDANKSHDTSCWTQLAHCELSFPMTRNPMKETALVLSANFFKVKYVVRHTIRCCLLSFSKGQISSAISK